MARWTVEESLLKLILSSCGTGTDRLAEYLGADGSFEFEIRRSFESWNRLLSRRSLDRLLLSRMIAGLTRI